MIIEKYIKIAILLAITAIGLGALATHNLEEILSESELDSFETGIRYQLFHAITLLILTLNNDRFNKNLEITLKLMVAGICCFSLSIYLLSMKNLINVSLSFLGPITPIGGVLLILSWIMLFFNLKKQV